MTVRILKDLDKMNTGTPYSSPFMNFAVSLPEFGVPKKKNGRYDRFTNSGSKKRAINESEVL